MDLPDFKELSPTLRVLLVLSLAVAAHLSVYAVRHVNQRVMTATISQRVSKARTVATLATSIAVFLLYFGAIGFGLSEFGVSITAYLASASILGLAIAFGSQGIVQDFVMGITIVFSDLFDVGDMVEMGGQTGIVRGLGMRFTVLVNSFGAEVYIPNRSISNVIRYPRGDIRCIADVTLAQDPDRAEKMEQTTRRIVTGFGEQFPGILRTPPDYEGQQRTSSGRLFLRVKFRIWPGRGGLIENDFRKELLDALKKIDSDYADWMVAVSYEVEQRAIRLGGRS